MGGVAGNLGVNVLATANSKRKEARSHLVPQALASNDGDFITNTLVGLEVQGQLWVVTFDYDFGRFLDGLRANATLFFAKTSAFVSSQCTSTGTARV